MAFESAFQNQFHRAADNALRIGLRGAFVEGCSYGVASALIYLAEALLFYTGAVLIARGIYSYLQMVEVLNLVVFTVTISSQLLAFSKSLSDRLGLGSHDSCLQHKRSLNRLKLLVTSIG
jgi:ATP-binding cassette subfamily B (MDR/TAP) protein 1